MHHANAALVTAITAAKNRERLVREFLEYRRSAVAEGEKSTSREYLLVPGHDPSRADTLARNLATQGIEVRRAEEAFKVGNRQVPAGTYIVSHAQPTGRLIRTCSIPTPISRRTSSSGRKSGARKRQPDQIYDITAWNLPMLYDVELVTSPAAHQRPHARSVPMTYDAPLPAAHVRRRRRSAYLMPWGTRRRGADRRGAAAGHPHAQRRRRLHAERAPLSARHGGDSRRRQPGRSSRAPDGARDQARRRDRADRHHLRRIGHLARQQRGGVPQGAARAAGLGHADLVALRRLDALHARAPLRQPVTTVQDRVARPRQPRRLRRHRAALGQLRAARSTMPCSTGSRTGCAPAAR